MTLLFPNIAVIYINLPARQIPLRPIEIPIINRLSTFSPWRTPAKKRNRKGTPWIWTPLASLPTPIIKLFPKANKKCLCKPSYLRRSTIQRKKGVIQNMKGKLSRKVFGKEQVNQLQLKLKVVENQVTITALKILFIK